MKIALTRLNRFLFLACILSVFLLGGGIGMILFYPGMTGGTEQLLTLDAPPPGPEIMPRAELTRNLFDPSGQAWQSPLSRRKAGQAAAGGDSGEIRGVISIPGISGVLTPQNFVPSGGSIGDKRIESLGGGRVNINGSQGTQEIDINQNRQQQIDALPLKIQ